MPGDAAKGLQFREPPIFERGSKGRSGVSLGALDVPEVDLNAALPGLSRGATASPGCIHSRRRTSRKARSK